MKLLINDCVFLVSLNTTKKETRFITKTATAMKDGLNTTTMEIRFVTKQAATVAAVKKQNTTARGMRFIPKSATAKTMNLNGGMNTTTMEI